MKNRDFDTLKRAQSYLTACVIRLGKNPIYIHKVEEGGNKKTKFVLKYNLVGEKEVLTVNLGHPKINMNPVKLGWLSCTPDSKYPAAYLSRKPNRTWHVGLCMNNGHYVRNYDNGYGVPLSFGNGFLAYSKELKNTILNIYPSFEDAKGYAITHPSMFWPFSRNFALFGKNVYYRYITHPVGKLEDGRIVLTEPATLLNEVLNEDLNVGSKDH